MGHRLEQCRLGHRIRIPTHFLVTQSPTRWARRLLCYPTMVQETIEDSEESRIPRFLTPTHPLCLVDRQ